MQDGDFCQFLDPRAEGPFSTAASRCVADAYIQGQIKGYDTIIRYYNRCRNALNITCRIPHEILSAIFNEVADAKSVATSSDNFANIGSIDWIQSVSHVCSHWREVALKIPNLWSNIPLNNPSWAEEMVRRSNPVPLTIRYRGPMRVMKNERCIRSFKTVTEILRFHLPRIKNLTLDSWPTFHHFLENGWPSSESIDILSLLNQPAPMMERLEVQLLNETPNKLPCELFTMSSRLRHLTLRDCWMTWDPELIDFGNLRSLELSNLPRETNPSLYQLLTVLGQTSRLESLSLERDRESGLGVSSLLPGVGTVPLRHLERITLIGLSYCVLLNHIVFSQNAHSIHLNVQDLTEIPSPLAHALAEKLDNGIEGSTLSLSLSSRSFQCWKSKDTIDMPSFHDPPTIDISSRSPNITIFEAGFLWRSLRLNQLISLKVDIPLEQVSWTFFGDLPQLRDIYIEIFMDKFLNALHHGLADAQPPVHMTFPALRNLKMVQCLLHRAPDFEDDAPFVSFVQLMSSCFELRKNAGLPLHWLRLQQCAGDRLQLERLRAVVDLLECVACGYGADDQDFRYNVSDGSGYEDEETYADFDPTQEAYDDDGYEDYGDYEDYEGSI
ncbi:hypothetical protein C0992_002103 [Termitomyces sp. T32_za158]|nr:hypothetical protein C0992_002103 [Termitomyces sp. T32_za158]